MGKLSRLKRAPCLDEISLLLTDDTGIARLNRQFLGKSGPTDVMAFEYEPVPGAHKRPTAEIVVNVERAVRAAPLFSAGDVSRELALYIAHGCDHLLGESDATDAGRGRMRRRELRWLRDARKRSLVDGLLKPVR